MKKVRFASIENFRKNMLFRRSKSGVKRIPRKISRNINRFKTRKIVFSSGSGSSKSLMIRSVRIKFVFNQGA